MNFADAVILFSLVVHVFACAWVLVVAIDMLADWIAILLGQYHETDRRRSAPRAGAAHSHTDARE